ncbi:unnamed protein product [Mucor fragilis]
MTHEEIKTKLPIIVASIPRKDCAQTQVLDQKNDDHGNLNDDSFSVLRDTSMMPITSDEEDSVVRERAMGTRTTPLRFVTGNPSRARSITPAANSYMTSTSNIMHRRVLSLTPESSIHRQIARGESTNNNTYHEAITHAAKAIHALTETSITNYTTTTTRVAGVSQLRRASSNDDLQSIYLESTLSSSHNALSLSSSATVSTNKSQPTLHSRPPSPVFSAALGLLATVTLRPQGEGMQAVEEMFYPDSAFIMSPAMNTVASSTLFFASHYLRTTATYSNQHHLTSASSAILFSTVTHPPRLLFSMYSLFPNQCHSSCCNQLGNHGKNGHRAPSDASLLFILRFNRL